MITKHIKIAIDEEVPVTIHLRSGNSFFGYIEQAGTLTLHSIIMTPAETYYDASKGKYVTSPRNGWFVCEIKDIEAIEWRPQEDTSF